MPVRVGFRPQGWGFRESPRESFKTGHSLQLGGLPHQPACPQPSRCFGPKLSSQDPARNGGRNAGISQPTAEKHSLKLHLPTQSATLCRTDTPPEHVSIWTHLLPSRDILSHLKHLEPHKKPRQVAKPGALKPKKHLAHIFGGIINNDNHLGGIALRRAARTCRRGSRAAPSPDCCQCGGGTGA